MSLFKLFLVISVALVLMLGSFACSSAILDFTVKSSVDFNHSHDVTIKGADVDNPPANPVTITSTATGGTPHTHTITLSKADYQSIKDGKTVSVVSSPFPANNHTHTFDIKKPMATTGSTY